MDIFIHMAEISMEIIQEAINRRRGPLPAGPVPQTQQTTGAAPTATPPAPATPPPSALLGAMAQRPEVAPTEGAAPTEGQESPEETKIVMQLLLKKLQTLLKQP